MNLFCPKSIYYILLPRECTQYCQTLKKILMSKDIRTKNVKKEKAVDKIKKVSDYKAESGNSFGAEIEA